MKNVNLLVSQRMVLQDERVEAEIASVKNGAKVALHEKHARARAMIGVDERELHGDTAALLATLVQRNVVRAVFLKSNDKTRIHVELFNRARVT